MKDLALKIDAIGQAQWHVGCFLLNWGRLESEIASSIFEIDPLSAGPHVDVNAAPRMLEYIVKQWFNVYCTRTAAQKEAAKKFKDGVLAAAKHRNTICHGFSGITTSPPTYAIICWEMYHKHRLAGNVPPVRYYSNIELANMCDQLGGFSKELDRLTKVAVDRPKKKPTPAGR